MHTYESLNSYGDLDKSKSIPKTGNGTNTGCCYTTDSLTKMQKTVWEISTYCWGSSPWKQLPYGPWVVEKPLFHKNVIRAPLFQQNVDRANQQGHPSPGVHLWLERSYEELEKKQKHCADCKKVVIIIHQISFLSGPMGKVSFQYCKGLIMFSWVTGGSPCCRSCKQSEDQSCNLLLSSLEDFIAYMWLFQASYLSLNFSSLLSFLWSCYFLFIYCSSLNCSHLYKLLQSF